MPGEGFIQHMISSLKSNKAMRNKNKFKDYGDEIIKDYNTKLKFKEVSEEELEKIKNKIRKRARRSNLISKTLQLFLILVVLAGGIFFVYKENEKEKKYKLYLIEKEKKDRFNTLIEEGDYHLGREKLESTLRTYKFAKELYPKDSLVNSRIKLVDSLIKVGYQPKIQ